jgi:hypothetical protein
VAPWSTQVWGADSLSLSPFQPISRAHAELPGRSLLRRCRKPSPTRIRYPPFDTTLLAEHVVSSVVVITRLTRGWQADCAVTREVLTCRSLAALDRRVRDLCRSASVTYQFQTGNAELDRLVAEARDARQATRLLSDRTRQLVDQVLALRIDASLRDLAVLLDLSHQRVCQLMERGRAG